MHFIYEKSFPINHPALVVKIVVISGIRQSVALDNNNLPETAQVSGFVALQLPENPHHENNRHATVCLERHYFGSGLAKGLDMEADLAVVDQIVQILYMLPEVGSVVFPHDFREIFL